MESSSNGARRAPGAPFGHAVVIGGSVAGLLCARVLSDHFARVTVLERDPRPDGPEPRKGAPQMRHVHALLDAASRGMDELFPGLIEELRGAGAVMMDAASGATCQYGRWKPRFKIGFDFVMCSRPLIEWHLRKRVETLPNVTIRYEHVAEDLILDQARERIAGVRVKGAEGEESLSADLVLDAAGRGSRVPRWLDALGYGRPEEQEVGVDLAYVTCLFERPRDFRGGWPALVVSSRPPGKRGCFILEVEGGRWLASMTGLFGDHCPTDPEGFLRFARSMPVPDAYEALKDATPLTAPALLKIPSSRWYHYESMKRFPEGLLLVGDSVCALNPIYGQGITVSVQAAKELQTTLARSAREGGGLRGLSMAFQKRLATLVGMAWTLSTTMDLRSPEATGKRPPGIGAVQWIFANLMDVTSDDEKACRIFYEMMHMRRGPEAFFHPDLLIPLLRHCAKSPFMGDGPEEPGPLPPAP